MMDRILIGMAMMSRSASPNYVLAYILNPAVRGSDKLVVHEASTYPAFVELAAARDAQMCAKISIAAADIIPFWMGRFIALTESDVVFGWTFTDKRVWTAKTLGFDYRLIEELYGESFARFINGVPHAHRIRRDHLADHMDAMLHLIAAGTDSAHQYIDMQAVDPGVGSTSYMSRGGSA